MPITEPAKALAEARARSYGHRVVQIIERLIEKHGASCVELSVAFDVYAPPPGKGGPSLVADWRAGRRSPDDEHRALLELLDEGELELQLAGAIGRRKVFKVVPTAQAA